MISPIMQVRVEETGPGEWTEHHRVDGGLAPFRELCAYVKGQLSLGSVMFGCQRAEVVETSCQCDRAPECLYVIRLDDWHMPTNESAFLKFRLRVTEKRVQELERVIGDLVSEEDLNALLHRVTVSAARAIDASAFMLILEESGPWHDRVYLRGLEKGDTEQIIVGLDEGPSTDLLVAEVVSARRRYGRSVASRPAGMFVPSEGRVLAS
jgi:hypothetical protein